MNQPRRALDGKTALVTGAATGIGEAIATGLAAAGASVVINQNHTPEPAEKVVADIQAAGGTAIAIAADVSSRAEYQAMVQRLLAEFGRWDILVNNAAVAVTKPFSQITEAEFDLSFAAEAFHEKTVEHPLVGTVTFTCEVLYLESGSQRMTVYQTTPGTPYHAAMLELFRLASPAGCPVSSAAGCGA